MISPSQFACTAAGIGPDESLGPLPFESAPCMFCGVAMAKGEPCEAVRLSRSFTDYASLAAPSSGLGCWGCQQARKAKHGMLQIAAKAVYTPDGVFKAHSRAEQAYHLYHPPRGRFLWVNSIGQAEHVVWRTPVALGPERFPVRVGPHLLVVERRRAFDVLDYWRRGMDAIRASDKKHEKMMQPCESLDADMMQGGALRLKRWVLAMGLPEVDDLAAALAQLSTGDAWALSVLVLYHNSSGWDVRPEMPATMILQ